MRLAAVVLASGLFAVGLSAESTKNPPPCPVTVPNGNAPPGETSNPMFHGNGALWTGLWPEGKVVFRPGGPGEVEPDGSLSMKFPFWRASRGKFTIKGRRLDAPAPPLRSYIPEGYADPEDGHIGFQATGLIFPTEGCWEVTARAGKASLTFVTLVVRLKEGK